MAFSDAARTVVISLFLKWAGPMIAEPCISINPAHERSHCSGMLVAIQCGHEDHRGCYQEWVTCGGM
jgi:hypothetical protein